MKRFLLAFFLMGLVLVTNAQYSLVGATYPTQDFNNLGTANSTVAGGDLNLVNATLNGWYFLESGTNANTTITAGTGSSTTGDTYNFGSSSAADRTLGGLQSSSLNPTFGFYFTNNTGAPITDLAITYTGEQWRLGTLSRVDRLDFQYSADATSLNTGSWTDVDGLDFTAPTTGPTTGALDGNLSANRTTISFTITGLNIANGSNFFIRWNDLNASGADDGLGVDDFGFIATLGSSNTITTGTVSSPPFVLASCAATATGTVDFTSTGTFNAGNTYTAQLSDDIGSFTTPTAIGTLVSTANAGTINITIPAGTAGGTGYRIRVVSDNPSVTGSQSAAFTITQNGTGGCSSSHTDYYRSFTTGDWSDPTSWESSPDNSNWITATLAPTYNANTILIQNGHTITIDGTSSADQLTIQSGGVLNHANGSVFTLNDGTGTDMTVSNGGTYVLNGNQPVATISTTVDVQNGALIRVDGNSSPAESDDFAFGAQATVTFNSGSIYEWNNILTPSWAGRTYFTSGQNTKYRFATAPGGSLGGTNATVVHGHIENNVNLTFINSGTKTIKNGIIGSGNIDASAAGSGAVIIDGGTAVLGGGTLTLQTGVPLQVTGTTVTMTSSKIITGDVQFSGITSIILGNNDLTVSGSISGYGSTAYVQTNGSGYLKMNGIGGTRVFPVGASSFNPLYVNNGGLADYSVRVEDGINPAIAFPTFGINRTWNIFASALTSGVELTFQYAALDANTGATPQPRNMEILQYSGSAWSITTGNGTITPVGSDPYTVVSVNPAGNLTIGTTSTPFALGVSGGYILPIECVVSLKAQKRNSSGNISWTVNSCAEVTSFELQRSVNGGAYQTIHTIRPSISETDFVFTDAQLGRGRNLYRIKVNRLSGSVKYSNTVALIHDSNDILITSLSPNPATSKTVLTISTARLQPISFIIYNNAGAIVKRWNSMLAEGNNNIDINVEGLPAGTYHILAATADNKTVSGFIKQ